MATLRGREIKLKSLRTSSTVSCIENFHSVEALDKLFSSLLYISDVIVTSPDYNEESHSPILRAPANIHVTTASLPDTCTLLNKSGATGLRCISNASDTSPFFSTSRDLLVNVNEVTYRSLGWQNTLHLPCDTARLLRGRKVLQIPLDTFRLSPLTEQRLAKNERVQKIFSTSRLSDMKDFTLYGHCLTDPSVVNSICTVLDAKLKDSVFKRNDYDEGMLKANGPPGIDIFSPDFCSLPDLKVDEILKLPNDADDVNATSFELIFEFLGKLATLSSVSAYDYDYVAGNSQLRRVTSWISPASIFWDPHTDFSSFCQNVFNASTRWTVISFKGKVLKTGMPGLNDEKYYSLLLLKSGEEQRLVIHSVSMY